MKRNKLEGCGCKPALKDGRGPKSAQDNKKGGSHEQGQGNQAIKD